ncbi:MAG: SIMPL domain-containing protein [Chloroflexota bacterium]
MRIEQSITNPHGITVYGSSIIRVSPDVARINIAVSQIGRTPQKAFSQARQAASKVQKYLSQAKVNDFGSSRINLSEAKEYKGNKWVQSGYEAKINFEILIDELDLIEEILVGVTNAGANQISNVNYQAKELKEIRQKARQQAVTAAIEKAESYCSASNTSLGSILHIEDVNPDQLRGREGHVIIEVIPDEPNNAKAFDPSSIVVGGAVMMSFEINSI